VVISTLSKGRSIGEMSVIDKTPRSATVKAKTKATLVALSAEGFDLILDQYPKIGIKILKGISRLLSQNLRKTSSRLADHLLPMG
jgi:CRP/FNR family cyclic AMP-dependent transcriptional regulator